ncbi:hypothetical protein DICVIV_02704 [Dictyocaulus viviparus]|uniref:Phosphatidate cytidylyltransferase, mitochondrial n=1 Tax=Dictyocaulus viviparus TaxID=29172 RepID=A0A0D8Y557_DICVI|nr:hypothetical protein DICVIV_02704 [Dictyocaulus viviparus]
MLMNGYKELLERLPLSTIEYAFAYGSAAFQQKGEDKEDKMVDFILSTNDPLLFHKENIKRNPSHYSLLRLIGAKALSNFQTRFAARVYFNTRVKASSRRMKYGIITTEDLNRDLLDWQWLYVSGRLHKPVLDVNIFSIISLLLLPDSFTLEELYEEIVALSYSGDFRMCIGEDRNKVKKIVHGSMAELSDIYLPLLTNDSRIVVQNGNVTIYHRLNLLPSAVLSAVKKNWNKKNKLQKDTEEVLFLLAHRHDVSSHVLAAISSIIAPVAISQTVKNAVSAGFTRSVIYGVSKLSKMIRSLKR